MLNDYRRRVMREHMDVLWGYGCGDLYTPPDVDPEDITMRHVNSMYDKVYRNTFLIDGLHWETIKPRLDRSYIAMRRMIRNRDDDNRFNEGRGHSYTARMSRDDDIEEVWGRHGPIVQDPVPQRQAELPQRQAEKEPEPEPCPPEYEEF